MAIYTGIPIFALVLSSNTPAYSCVQLWKLQIYSMGNNPFAWSCFLCKGSPVLDAMQSITTESRLVILKNAVCSVCSIQLSNSIKSISYTCCRICKGKIRDVKHTYNDLAREAMPDLSLLPLLCTKGPSKPRPRDSCPARSRYKACVGQHQSRLTKWTTNPCLWKG